MPSAQTKLKRVLLGNAIFSTVSGLSLLLFTDPIAAFMNIGMPSILMWLGVGLLLFAGLVAYHATRPTINAKQVQSIIIQDWAWVAGSAGILLFQLFNLSFWGYALVADVAVVVAVFALLQSRNLKRIASK